MKILAEEIKVRQRLEYTLKNRITRAAKKYHAYRRFIYRQLKKQDGTVRSSVLKLRRPEKNSSTAHTKAELDLIKRMLKRNGNYGLKCMEDAKNRNEYKRSFENM